MSGAARWFSTSASADSARAGAARSGDGLLVYFGYPQAHEDDAERAVRAGREILRDLRTLNARLETEHGLRLQVRIGIHTGPVVVGEMGGSGKPEMLALGDTLNVAARLEAFAEPDTLVISDATLRLVAGLFVAEGRGTPALKGISEPIRVYRVVQPSGVVSRLDRAPRLTPFVGREQELGLLLDRFEQAQERRGQAVLIAGEAGIGKSRLVHRLRERLREAPHSWLECRSSPYTQNSALHPVIELVEQGLRFEDDLSPEQKLERLVGGLALAGLEATEAVPLLASLLSLRLPERYAPLEMSPQLQRHRTLEVLLAWALALGEKRPVVLVAEDLHWIDPSTLEWLGLLIEQCATASVLLLLTFRPDFEPPWPARGHVLPIALSRLSRRQAKELVAAASGEALPEPVVDQLAARSDGIPLFVEELAKGVVESRRDLAGPLSALEIPETLQDSLMARLDRLGEAKQVAQLGAAIGREFPYALLEAVAPLKETALREGLGRLVEAELVYQRGLPPRATYTFKHALVQEAAYHSLLESQRRELHGRIAAILAERFAESVETQPELLAQHLTAAGQLPEAIEYWRRAGLGAIQRAANLEAIHHLERALEALEGLAESPERDKLEIGLLVALGPVMSATRGWSAPEVGRLYERARDLCRRLGDAPQLFTALWGVWFYNVTRGQLQTALELGEQLMGLAERQTDPGLVMQAHHMLGPTLLSLGPLTSARSHFEAAIALYDPGKHRSHASLYGGHDPCVCCSGFGSWAHWILGSPDLALRRAREAIDLARELKQPTSLAHALLYAATLHQLRREPEAARDIAAACLTIATEHDLALYQMMSRFIRGWAVARAGLRGEGLAEMHQAQTAVKAAGLKLWAPHFAGMVAEACDEVARVEDGLAAVSEGLEHETGERYYEAELHRLRGELVLLQHGASAFTEADACFQRALEISRQQEARAWELRAAMSLVRLWQGRERHADAHQLLSGVYSAFSEGFDTPDLKDARKLLERP